MGGASVIVAAMAAFALVVSNGGAGVARDINGGDRAISGEHAPGIDLGEGKTVGGLSGGRKVVGGPVAKSAKASDTVRALAGPADLLTGRGGIALTATPAVNAPGVTSAGAPTSSTAPTTSVARGAPTTTARTVAPATTTTTRNVTPSPTGWTPTGPVYWLSTDGNDNANGSEGAPWRSFATALSRLRPGDNLLVKAGTYGTTSSGPTIDAENINGTPGAPITVAAAPGQRVSLLGGGYQVVRIGGSSYVDLRGFDVSGSGQLDRATTSGIEADNAHHIRFIANTVHDLGGGGIGAIGSNHVTIDGNRVYNTSMWNPNQASAIATFESANIGGGDESDGYSFHIRNNIAYNNKNLVGAITDGNCIIIDSNRHTGYSGTSYINNNLCYGNGGRGVHVFISDNVVAVNNTLIGNVTSAALTDAGELSAIQASNVTFINNLASPTRSGYGAREYLASATTYEHNLFVGAMPDRHGSTDLAVPDAQLGPDSVPLAGSPAIDAGTDDRAPSTDRRGRARVGAPDIGCYEA